MCREIKLSDGIFVSWRVDGINSLRIRRLSAFIPITSIQSTRGIQYTYSDPYDAEDYDNVDDFAEEWAEEFGDGDYDDGYDDAYDYWENAMNQI